MIIYFSQQSSEYLETVNLILTKQNQDLVQHFRHRLNQLLNNIGVSLFVDIRHFHVCGCQGQRNDQLFVALGVLVQFVAQHVVVVLGLLVQQVKHLIDLG